jgi:hypothetical protein
MPTWQSPYRAQRCTLKAYMVPMFCPSVRRRAPCVIHGEQGDQKPHLHHLDELGGKPSSSFFENLVPICAEENNEIEDNRKSGTVEPLRGCLRPKNLLELSWDLYWEGQVLRAYACSRLVSFLAWRPGRPGSKVAPEAADRNPPMEMATQCLLCLRVADPEYAVPLAIDTLDRSILPHLKSRSEAYPLLDSTLFSLAVAAGAFHRDYGDYPGGGAYFDLAEKYLQRISTAVTREQLDRFDNHRVINSVVGLEAQSTDRFNRAEMRSRVRDSEYGSYLGGRMNVLYWELRELRLHCDPERITQELKHVPLAFLNHGAERLRQEAWRKHIPKFTPILESEYIVMDADARSNVGLENDARELLRIAAEAYKDGHFGASHIPNAKVIEDITNRNPGDFQLPFKQPWALIAPHYRTEKFGAKSFQGLSDELLRHLLTHNDMRERNSLQG